MALVVLVVTISMAVGTGRGQPRSSEVLRVRGLIIEDRDGRERILLGAPVPKVTGRKRADDVTGLVVLGDNGADRVQIGNVAGLKVAGEHGPGFERIGLVVNNKTGKALMKLADTNDSERMMVEVEGQTPARLLVIDATTGRRDVLEKLQP